MTKWKKTPKVSHLYIQRGGPQTNNRNLLITMHQALWPGPQPSSPLIFSLSYQSTNLFGLLLYLVIFTQSNLEKPWALHQHYLISSKQQSTRFLLLYSLGLIPMIWLHFQGILHGLFWCGACNLVVSDCMLLFRKKYIINTNTIAVSLNLSWFHWKACWRVVLRWCVQGRCWR